MQLISTLLFCLTLRTAVGKNGHFDYSKSTKECKVVNAGLGCLCNNNAGLWKECHSKFDGWLVNEDGNLIERPDGAASVTCEGYELKGTILHAKCRGTTKNTKIDLNENCGNHYGELLCGAQRPRATSSTRRSPVASVFPLRGSVSTPHKSGTPLPSSSRSQRSSSASGSPTNTSFPPCSHR